MKAVVSTTYDSKYHFFLPLVCWAWNKLNVGLICFMPTERQLEQSPVTALVDNTLSSISADISIKKFFCPEHKEATYSQCSRLYAACLGLPEDEVLITSDIDMAVFGDYLRSKKATFDIFGADLVPVGQYPMCFISATVSNWRKAMQINGKSYQQCLDELVGSIECSDFRGNQWSLDQDTANKQIGRYPLSALGFWLRTNGQNQFATNRVDRDDTNWRNRINENLVDAHLWRPGYTDESFANIMELMTTMYPNENFDWLIEYRNKYVELL